MDRRTFCERAGCGVAGLAAVPALGAVANQTAQSRPLYRMAVEIVGSGGARCGQGMEVGDRFELPDDLGSICPWLLDSMNPFIRVLENGGTLFWTYRGTPYEKEIDPDGVTTEFVRCPDPTPSGVVAKIIRTRVA